MLTLNLELSEQLERKLAAKLKREKLTDIEYVSRLIEQDLDSRIELGEGFYYHKQSDELRNNEDKEIKLSKIEKRIIQTLIEHNGEITPVDVIKNSAWDTLDVSIYTFRNMIKKIREKTYYDLIINHSTKGYTITIEDGRMIQ